MLWCGSRDALVWELGCCGVGIGMLRCGTRDTPMWDPGCCGVGIGMPWPGSRAAGGLREQGQGSPHRAARQRLGPHGTAALLEIAFHPHRSNRHPSPEVSKECGESLRAAIEMTDSSCLAELGKRCASPCWSGSVSASPAGPTARGSGGVGDSPGGPFSSFSAQILARGVAAELPRAEELPTASPRLC